MSNEIAIKVENLSKVYRLYDKPTDRLKESIHPMRKKYHKDFYALKDISFEVKKGETVGIIGKNGSGKSTLLKIITGVLTPTAGNVTITGKVSALLELGAGFNPEYTGIENIYLNGTLMGYSKEEMDTKVQDIIDFADIGDFVYQPVKMYSSGMFARLAFAVAINVDPDILIVDEALSVGDVAFQLKCYRKFNDFKKAGKTILFVSHSMDSILKYCSSSLVLNQGVKIEEGTPRMMVDVYKKLLSNCYNFDESEDCDQTIQQINHKAEEWKKSFNINPSLLNYGNSNAEIIDYGIFEQAGRTSTNIIGDNITSIRMKVKFNKKICNPIFAFSIKDIKGNEIAGTNTLIEDIETGEYRPNDEVVISFSQRLNLQSGIYTLSLGCTKYEGDDLVVFHRLYDLLIFEVISKKQIFGIFDICSSVKISRIQIAEGT